MKIINPLKIMSLAFCLAVMFSLSFSQNIYANDTSSFNNQTNYATSSIENISIENLNNGDYITTIISSDNPSSDNLLNVSTFAASKTITKTKTTYYKNSSGSILWSVSIKATFTYNGNISKCTSCSHNATAPAKSWSIKSCTSSKSGHTATAKAIVTHTDGDGTKYNINRNVTISCSASGKIS